LPDVDVIDDAAPNIDATASSEKKGNARAKRAIEPTRETEMKFRIFVPGLLVLAGAVLGQQVHARTIQVDATMTCTSVVKATGSLSVPLSGTGDSGNSAKADVNFPVLACKDSVGNDTSLTVLSYDAKNSVLYTWIDLSAAGGTPSSLCLVPPLESGCSQLAELSSFYTGGGNPPNVPIIAMVDVLKLTKGHSGDYEILVNYEAFPASECDNIFKPINPTFSWFGKTYTFTGSKSAANPCESSATNDFLFGPNGVLLGHNSAPDGSPTFVLTKGLPPGWTVN